MHDDVTSQERSKERLFEEEIELKWEKGGSGLVFYTDAQYWQEEEGGMQQNNQTCSFSVPVFSTMSRCMFVYVIFFY